MLPQTVAAAAKPAAPKAQQPAGPIPKVPAATATSPLVKTTQDQAEVAAQPETQNPHGQTSADPIYHRDHPLLYVRFKPMVAVGIREPISTWISTFFGAGAAAQESQHLIQMESNRNKLCMMSECTPETFSHDAFEKSYLPACSAYITDLDCLLTKTQGTSFEGGIPNLRFIWQHWLGPDYDRLDTNSLHLELCCNLFNLAAAYSLMGCVIPAKLHGKSRLVKEVFFQEHQDVLQYRCRMFKISAILFDSLRKRLSVTNTVVDDISPIIAEMFCSVMLAQAQECFYHMYKEPSPTPAAEKQYACLLVAATTYYNSFLTNYEKLKKMASPYEDDENEPTMTPAANIPTYWVLHCSAIRTLLRANALIHMSRFHEGDTEAFGFRVGYTGKAFVITDEEIKALDLHDIEKPIEALVKILTKKREVAREMHSKLAEENRTIYKCSLPSKAVIDSLVLTPDSKVVIGENPDISSVPLLSVLLKRGKDTFPAILSLASANAWLEYRATRIERILVHLKGVESHNEVLFTVFEHHPEYIFLYFMYQRLMSVMANEKNAPPIGLYQSKLGAEILSVRNPAVHGQLSIIAERSHPEAVARANKSMVRLRATHAAVKQVSTAETIERRVSILESEHSFCTKSQAGQSLEFYSRNKDQYNWVKSSEYGTPLVDKLFGPFKAALFEFPKSSPPSAAVQTPSSASPQTKTPSTGLFSAFWGSPPVQPTSPGQDSASMVPEGSPQPEAPAQESLDQKIAGVASVSVAVSLAKLVVELIDTNFIEREKVEDALASEMLRNVERKDTELDKEDLSLVSSWIDREISWLMERSQKIYDHIHAEKDLLSKMEQLDPGIDIVNEDIIHVFKNLIVKPEEAAPPMPWDGSTYSAAPLWEMIRGVFRFKQAKRFASLCKHIEEAVDVEAESICRQCDDFILLARSQLGRGPPLRASSISVGNAAPNMRAMSPPSANGGHGMKDSNFYKP